MLEQELVVSSHLVGCAARSEEEFQKIMGELVGPAVNSDRLPMVTQPGLCAIISPDTRRFRVRGLQSSRHVFGGGGFILLPLPLMSRRVAPQFRDERSGTRDNRSGPPATLPNLGSTAREPGTPFPDRGSVAPGLGTTVPPSGTIGPALGTGRTSRRGRPEVGLG